MADVTKETLNTANAILDIYERGNLEDKDEIDRLMKQINPDFDLQQSQKEEPTVLEFFEMYNDLFYEIPKEGEEESGLPVGTKISLERCDQLFENDIDSVLSDC